MKTTEEQKKAQAYKLLLAAYNNRIRFLEILDRIRARRKAKLKQRQDERRIERRYSGDRILTQQTLDNLEKKISLMNRSNIYFS